MTKDLLSPILNDFYPNESNGHLLLGLFRRRWIMDGLPSQTLLPDTYSPLNKLFHQWILTSRPDPTGFILDK